MLVANYSSVRNNLKSICDMATEKGETVLVTRKENRNIVILSLDRFNEMERQLQNALYVAKINNAFDQLYSGNGTSHELIEE